MLFIYGDHPTYTSQGATLSPACAPRRSAASRKRSCAALIGSSRVPSDFRSRDTGSGIRRLRGELGSDHPSLAPRRRSRCGFRQAALPGENATVSIAGSPVKRNDTRRPMNG